eukprot:1158975-Pelagomonas_calceolata.AAC.31
MTQEARCSTLGISTGQVFNTRQEVDTAGQMFKLGISTDQDDNAGQAARLCVIVTKEALLGGQNNMYDTCSSDKALTLVQQAIEHTWRNKRPASILGKTLAHAQQGRPCSAHHTRLAASVHWSHLFALTMTGVSGSIFRKGAGSPSTPSPTCKTCAAKC